MSTARRYAGETPDQRLHRRRRAFLDAGLQLFGTIGFRGTSMRAICREANLSDRYFYEQFATTEDLLADVLGECSDRLERAVMAAIEAAEPTMEQVSRSALDAFLATAENDPRLAQVGWIEAIGVSPRIDKLYRQINDRFAMIILLTAIDFLGGDPNDQRNLILAAAIDGAIKETVVRWIMDDFQPSRSDLVEYLTELMLSASTLMH